MDTAIVQHTSWGDRRSRSQCSADPCLTLGVIGQFWNCTTQLEISDIAQVSSLIKPFFRLDPDSLLAAILGERVTAHVGIRPGLL